eukprot:CAMPEP_0172738722 /NCGR_PEP_ID=MMETSP1074-20121228/120852_1 /TAXON_ID=2916 /ORGANISM="Ceratium fusus, Strain PA161109" /LENGTH=114 /DNA_ID=CAMNT_0013568421 /DNA_START=625 /DNA_END=969 /DNA_ORIENTATION=-
MPPGLTIEAEHVAEECGAPCHHFVPVVVKWPEEYCGWVKRYASISSQQRIVDCIPLQPWTQIDPSHRQFHAAYILIYLVLVQQSDVEVASIVPDGFQAKLKVWGQFADRGFRTS